MSIRKLTNYGSQAPHYNTYARGTGFACRRRQTDTLAALSLKSQRKRLFSVILNGMYIPTQREKALLAAFCGCRAALPRERLLAAAGGGAAAKKALEGCAAKGFIAQDDDGARRITEAGKRAL